MNATERAQLALRVPRALALITTTCVRVRVRVRERVRDCDCVCVPWCRGAQNMNSRQCATQPFGPGPPSFVSNLLSIVGINPRQLQHYPYVRQWDGPTIHLDRASFDCSAANYRR